MDEYYGRMKKAYYQEMGFWWNVKRIVLDWWYSETKDIKPSQGRSAKAANKGKQ